MLAHVLDPCHHRQGQLRFSISFILSLSVDLGGGWQRGRIRFAAEKWSHQFDHCCCFVVELFLGSVRVRSSDLLQKN